MVDLLTFFHGTLGHQVPQEARAWLLEHVDPDVAIERAHAVHLLWLSSLCEEQTSREVVDVCFGRLATRSSYLDTQREPQDPEAGAELAQASGRLRRPCRAPAGGRRSWSAGRLGSREGWAWLGTSCTACTRNACAAPGLGASRCGSYRG